MKKSPRYKTMKKDWAFAKFFSYQTRDVEGFFWKMLSTTCFAVISMIVCWMGRHKTALTTSQMAFFQLFLPFLTLTIARGPQEESWTTRFLTRAPHYALWRSFLSSIAFLSWFCLLRTLPLAIAVSFKLLTPLITFIAALVILKERATLWRLGGIILLLIGAFWLIRSEVWQAHTFKESQNLLHLMLLPALLLVGHTGANLAGKALMKRVKPMEATYSLLALNSLFIGGFALATWGPVAPHEWLWLGIIGCLELLAQWALARALSLTDLNLLAPLSLWRFGITTLFGLLFLGETPTLQFFMGVMLFIMATPFMLISKLRKPLKA